MLQAAWRPHVGSVLTDFDGHAEKHGAQGDRPFLSCRQAPATV